MKEVMKRDNKYVPVPTNFLLGANRETAEWLNSQSKQAEKEELTAVARNFAMGAVLIEVRKQCGKGFLKWIDENTEISQAHAYNCINLFEYRNNPRIQNSTSLNDMLRAIRELNKEKQLAEIKTSNVRSFLSEGPPIDRQTETSTGGSLDKWHKIYKTELETCDKNLIFFVKRLNKKKTDLDRLNEIDTMKRTCERIKSELQAAK